MASRNDSSASCKENLLWVRHFATVAELIEALREFRRRYNGKWLIERHGFRTPSQERIDFAAASKPRDDGSACCQMGRIRPRVFPGA
jgi:hypothetical protein